MRKSFITICAVQDGGTEVDMSEENLHKTLYRKWRPDTFQSVVGQEHITSILKYQIKNGTTSHAYLFSGSRGTGKTSCAKIMAQAINCLSPKDGNPCGECEACRLIMSGAATDIVEMDAASNNGVDYIRDIKDEVIYAPAMLKSRVYIIDEVHMLSQSAFNALLKTLEEPPSRVVFILATTEIQKIPATIISRCQRFDFRRISTPDIVARLEYIAQNEGIRLTSEASRLIARLSQGGLRDAISMLELCAGGDGDIDVKKVRACAGIAGRELLEKMVMSVMSQKYESIFSEIAYLYSSSVELGVFFSDLISFYRDMLVIKSSDDAGKYIDITEEELQRTRAIADRISRPRLLYHIKLLEDAFITMQRDSSTKRLCAEMTLIRMCDETLDSSPEALASRIAALEDQIRELKLSGTAYTLTNAPYNARSPQDTKTPNHIDMSAAAGSADQSNAQAGNIYASGSIYGSTSDSSSAFAPGNTPDSGNTSSDNGYDPGSMPAQGISNAGSGAQAQPARSYESEVPWDTSPEDINHNITAQASAASDIAANGAYSPADSMNDNPEAESPAPDNTYGIPESGIENPAVTENIISPGAGKTAAPERINGIAMHPVDAWAEVVGKIRKTDDGAASMLDRAKAYISDKNEVEIIVDNAFALMIVDNDDIKKQIASYLTSLSQSGEVSFTAIKFRHIKQSKDNTDPLSEIGR